MKIDFLDKYNLLQKENSLIKCYFRKRLRTLLL